jgi:hypothetical protein
MMGPTRLCKYCQMTIPLKATRCPFCQTNPVQQGFSALGGCLLLIIAIPLLFGSLLVLGAILFGH